MQWTGVVRISGHHETLEVLLQLVREHLLVLDT
jgi:hypothetical protein